MCVAESKGAGPGLNPGRTGRSAAVLGRELLGPAGIGAVTETVVRALVERCGQVLSCPGQPQTRRCHWMVAIVSESPRPTASILLG